MSPSRLPRLKGFAYRGHYRYFLTTCVDRKRPVFLDVAEGQTIVDQLLNAATRLGFAVLAYCVMPDHVHALVEGLFPSSDFRALVHSWKQRTGYDWKQRRGERLWQRGYYEYVLREDDSAAAVARYIIENPVRAGLVTIASNYPLSGPPGTAGLSRDPGAAGL